MRPDYCHYKNFTIEVTYFPEYDAYTWEAFDGKNRLKMSNYTLLKSKEYLIKDAHQKIDIFIANEK